MTLQVSIFDLLFQVLQKNRFTHPLAGVSWTEAFDITDSHIRKKKHLMLQLKITNQHTN